MPRSFCITPASNEDHSGALLCVGNQESDNIRTYWIDCETGGLTFTGNELELPSPACLLYTEL